VVFPNWDGIQKRLTHRRAVALSMLLVLAIGALDYRLGDGVSLVAAYILPIAMATWFVGDVFAIVLSLESAVIWVVSDVVSGHYASRMGDAIWNVGISTTFYVLFVILLRSLRKFHADVETSRKNAAAALNVESSARTRLESLLLEAGERERRRLGYDLHDGLCQHLAGTALAAQVLKEKLIKREVSEVAEAGQLVDFLEEGILMARNLAYGLQPVAMHEGALMQSLQELAGATEGLFKVKCRFECDSPVAAPDLSVAEQMYRIAQEAVGNAVQRGRADNVVIGLEISDDGTRLSVTDDGIGMEMSREMSSRWGVTNKTRGMGLRIMATRAQVIEAQFDIRPNIPKGTVVSCYLPAKGAL
jgi:signal transduction histidine kinase